MRPLNRQALDTDLDEATPAQRDRVRLFRLLLGLGAALKTKMDRTFASAGVTTQQAHLLTLARASKEPLSQGELARRMGVSHQNVKQIAVALERKGLLTFQSSPDDARVRRLVPTARSRQLFRRRNARDFEEVAGWFEGLGDREVRGLVDGLVRVASVLGRQRDEESP